jgi:hypothetical protein
VASTTCHSTCGHVLRRGVAVGAHDPGGDVRLAAHGPLLGEPEVGQLGVEVRVHQDVGGLEVPVDDGAVGAVEEGEPPRRVARDLHPRRPRQAAGAPEQVLLQAAPGHVLVHQQPVGALAAVADELYQVRVPVLPQVTHLCLHARARHNKQYLRSYRPIDAWKNIWS